MDSISKTAQDKLIFTAIFLSGFTIVYNIAEGLVSTWFGYGDETLALFGFGIDSFVEVLSGIGIAHMLYRMKKNPDISARDTFENRALRTTGIAFFLLAGGLVIGALLSFYNGSQPRTTVAGMIISGISIVTMYALYKAKLNVGKKLKSEAILADAECTKTCYYLSFVLLGSSLAWELAMVPYIDAVGSLGIAWFAYNEGKESFEKIRNNTFACSGLCHTEISGNNPETEN